MFLLILTDGDLSDIKREERALNVLSGHKVAVGAIAIGDGPFSDLDRLNQMLGRKFDNFYSGTWKPGDDAGTKCFQELVSQYDAMKRLGYFKKETPGKK